MSEINRERVFERANVELSELSRSDQDKYWPEATEAHILPLGEDGEKRRDEEAHVVPIDEAELFNGAVNKVYGTMKLTDVAVHFAEWDDASWIEIYDEPNDLNFNSGDLTRWSYRAAWEVEKDDFTTGPSTETEYNKIYLDVHPSRDDDEMQEAKEAVREAAEEQYEQDVTIEYISHDVSRY